jgi:MarR family transcriptional regulator, organic hydroperoxide resistance regulator
MSADAKLTSSSETAEPIPALVPYDMNRLVSRLNQNLSAKLRRRRLTLQHWRVLVVLAGSHDGCTLSTLVERTMVPQSTLSRLVDRMERAGMVSRRPGRDDFRFIEIWLTPAGRTIHDQTLPLAAAEYQAAVSGFSADELTQLKGFFDRMRRNLAIE